jgi:hypothetical protein
VLSSYGHMAVSLMIAVAAPWVSALHLVSGLRDKRMK